MKEIKLKNGLHIKVVHAFLWDDEELDNTVEIDAKALSYEERENEYDFYLHVKKEKLAFRVRKFLSETRLNNDF